MQIFVQITVAGVDAGPFDLYSDLDLITPFATGISKATLLVGDIFTVINGTTSVIIISTGDCTNITILPTTTTSTSTTSTSTSTTSSTSSTSSSSTSSTTTTRMPDCSLDGYANQNNDGTTTTSTTSSTSSTTTSTSTSSTSSTTTTTTTILSPVAKVMSVVISNTNEGDFTQEQNVYTDRRLPGQNFMNTISVLHTITPQHHAYARMYTNNNRFPLDGEMYHTTMDYNSTFPVGFKQFDTALGHTFRYLVSDIDYTVPDSTNPIPDLATIISSSLEYDTLTKVPGAVFTGDYRWEGAFLFNEIADVDNYIYIILDYREGLSTTSTSTSTTSSTTTTTTTSGGSPTDSGIGIFEYAHSSVVVNDEMYLGERKNSNPQIIRFSDKTNLQVHNSQTIASVSSLETCCYSSANPTKIYFSSARSGNLCIVEVPLNNLSYILHDIPTIVDFGSVSIIGTDGTYIYGANESEYFKIQISDWSVVATNPLYAVHTPHSIGVNPVRGEMYIVTGYTSPYYFTKISLTDLSVLGNGTGTDISAYVSHPTDDLTFYNDKVYIGGEVAVGGAGGAVITLNTLDTVTGFVLNPTYGLFNDGISLYSCAISGAIEHWLLSNLSTMTSYSLPGIVPNELLLLSDSSKYVTAWGDITIARLLKTTL